MGIFDRPAIRKFLATRRRRNIISAGLLIVTVAILFRVFVHSEYKEIDRACDKVEVSFNHSIKPDAIVAYFTDSTEVATNFTIKLIPTSVNDNVLRIDLGRAIKLRQIRFYVQPPFKNLEILQIQLHSGQSIYPIDLREWNGEGVVLNEGSHGLNVEVVSELEYAFIESPKFYYPSDYPMLAAAMIVTLIILYLLGLFIQNVNEQVPIKSLTIQDLAVVSFFLGIFLPRMYFTMTLGISAVLIIPKFQWHAFRANSLNFIFILFYLVILSGFLIVSPDHDFKQIEKYTPFLVLPIYVACVQNTRILIFFCFSAFLIGAYFFIQAAINLAVFKNIEIISFDNFTGEMHPVYYAYLIVFSVVLVEFGTTLRKKYLIHAALLILLVLCSSKIMLLTLLVCVLVVGKGWLRWFSSALLLIALVSFAPLRDRMISIMNIKDASIVSEYPVTNPHDPRLNGFTLRLILWQESFRGTTLSQVCFGKGPGESGVQALEDALRKRGLTAHLWYNAHNQYITTLMMSGIVGFALLVCIILTCARKGILEHNRLLVCFAIIMAFAFLSESVFERNQGIVFFVIVALLLTRPITPSTDISKPPDEGLVA